MSRFMDGCGEEEDGSERAEDGGRASGVLPVIKRTRFTSC